MTEHGDRGAPRPPNIVLIGMMGCGKSAIGRRLADWLGVHLNDIDATIEYEAGRTIAEIFREQGEAIFRKIERDVIARAVRDRPCVIATGGGAFADSSNRAHLRSGGAVVVYLKASPELLASRVRRSRKRPLLSQDEPLDRIRELLVQREPMYLLADHAIETDQLNVEETVARILTLLGRAP